MNRHILHMDLDCFFVEAERRSNSNLIGKPIVIGGSTDRGVVASCSYEARQFGLYSGMSARYARQLCPHAIWIRGDYDVYEKYSGEVTQIIAESAPAFEKASIDEHYVDISGMDKHFGCLTWSHELRIKIIHETGLPISFGLSGNKTVSKVATGQAKPNGELNIIYGTEKPFLAPLSIRKIPGLGEKRYGLLRNMGVHYISTLQQLHAEQMEQVLGKDGLMIWQKANGIDDRPIIPYNERKSIGTEDTFEQDTTDMELLHRKIVTMITDIAYKLRKEGKVANTVVLKIRYANHDTYSLQQRIPHSNADHTLTETALALFKKLYSRRMLIRLIGVKLTGLASGGSQINLFEDTPTQTSLYKALDNIRNRFGGDAIMKAVSIQKS